VNRHIIVVATGLAAGVACQPVATGNDSEAVRSVVATMDSAWNRKDTAAVSRLLLPTYVYFSSHGNISPRGQSLAMLAAPHYQLEYADRSELEIHLSGNSAVVGSRWRGRGSWEGRSFVDDQRCSLTLARGPEGWRVLSEHCTQITG
jgi:ketosteroid isomerase-like protein